MDITVSAADANRKFSELLRGVREGRSYTVTSHGRPVAKITPVDAKSDAEKDAAWEKLLARLHSQPAQNLPKMTRDEMHARD